MFTKRPELERAQALAALRDLLGLMRALYAAARSEGATADELARLRGIGLELRAAHRDLWRAYAGTVQADEAMRRAEAAAARVVVSPFAAAGTLVEAAAKRVVVKR